MAYKNHPCVWEGIVEGLLPVIRLFTQIIDYKPECGPMPLLADTPFGIHLTPPITWLILSIGRDYALGNRGIADFGSGWQVACHTVWLD